MGANSLYVYACSLSLQMIVHTTHKYKVSLQCEFSHVWLSLMDEEMSCNSSDTRNSWDIYWEQVLYQLK